ncbi:D-alanyl-D-alanine carboxypeptidase [Terrimonas pollutisoli]|uniref:D-alanyl-D-alanine carboxypeptidase n=1 Tax=Terrimonas pollutisoli TaxID=3034147 RepID=UPI0023ED415C|nr:D-alanyl-D-alanine carboxypeptidase [Terrimonas sp. H1YJ31]
MLNFQIRKTGPGFSYFVILTSYLLFASCSVQKKIAKSADIDVLDVPALQTAHVGISIYEPASGKHWYDYNGEKYFVPASNVKIPTCYAAMKYLGDSLTGLRYVGFQNNKGEKSFWLQPTGDPTLLHPDFTTQPVIDFFKKDTTAEYLLTTAHQWEDTPWGAGWSWGDYAVYYMAERSQFPIYGNVVHIQGSEKGITIFPGQFEFAYEGKESTPFFDRSSNKYSFNRVMSENKFLWRPDSSAIENEEIPFITSTALAISLLKDTVRGLKLAMSENTSLKNAKKIFSQRTDAMLSLMMHRSDNFFAEQALQMVSNERLGVMNDAKIIDTILKTDFKDLPQKPKWADGSGLSRYNLFTPQNFVAILNKMRQEFGVERIKIIFPTGGRGTLENYYVADSNSIYAKTGTLSGVVAISGFLQTKKNRQLIFSVLVNNHQASPTDIRRAVEKFLQTIRNKF